MPLDFIQTENQLQGLKNYHDGLAAEDIAAIEYHLLGASILEQRWRSPSGEIDIIAKQGDEYVFVEVKKSKTHDCAAHSLKPRQIDRICAAANDYLATVPNGSLAFWRVDGALVDASGVVKILSNITM